MDSRGNRDNRDNRDGVDFHYGTVLGTLSLFSLAITKFRRKLDPNLSHSANRHKTHSHYQAKLQNGLFL